VKWSSEENKGIKKVTGLKVVSMMDHSVIRKGIKGW
jgi:hypothetical protein